MSNRNYVELSFDDTVCAHCGNALPEDAHLKADDEPEFNGFCSKKCWDEFEELVEVRARTHVSYW